MTFSQAASSASASSAPAIHRLGRFHIVRELGRGTVGCVYLAHDPVVGRDVALKTFSPRLTPVDKSRHEAQFINEARAAGLLSHPNIVTVYDASSENGTTWIAMEYLQGRELSRMLKSGHRFTPQETAAIIRKIANALDYMHKKEVIHRDIKPGNIFMVDGERPKLIDFGIARSPNRIAAQLVNADESYTLFRNNVLGTPNYMSPEQARGEDVDARTDIYSLGAVMYEMLTGCKPFAAVDADDLLQQVAYKAPPAPVEIDPAIPYTLSLIVMKAMSKRPEKRHETAGQMAMELKRFLVYGRRAYQRTKMQEREELSNAGHRPSLNRNAWYWLGGGALALTALASMRFL